VNGLGYINGFINGNGVINGLINGNGAINGFVNGRGKVNGFVNGKGLINDNGFVNGTGIRHAVDSEETRWSRNIAIIATVCVIILLVPTVFILYQAPQAPGPINIDGLSNDWVGVPGYADSAGDQTMAPSINLIEYKTESDENNIYMYLRTEGQPFSAENGGVDSYIFLLDADRNSGTGYALRGFGIDYYIAAHGWNGSMEQLAAYGFGGRNGHNNETWEDFVRIGTPRAKVGQDFIEVSMSKTLNGIIYEMAPVILFYSTDSKGNRDHSDLPLSERMALMEVDQSYLAPAIVDAGSAYVFLELELEANGPALELGQITVHDITTTGFGFQSLESMHVYRDDNRNGIIQGDAILDTGSMVQGPSLTFTLQDDIWIGNASQTGLLIGGTVRSDAAIGSTVGFGVKASNDFGVAEGDANLASNLTGRSYIGSAPPGIQIDGMFQDWQAIPLFTDMDDDASDGSQNIDIRDTAFHADNEFTSFYARVDGIVLWGEDLPVSEQRPTTPYYRDADGDGYPDAQDPYPNDFDNDGVMDVEDSDKDNDGILDIDWGGTDSLLMNIDTGAVRNMGPRPPPDHDHDGLPFGVDGDDWDFNNDGIPDNNTMDDDGDGTYDYPDGDDWWLYNSVTGRSLFIGTRYSMAPLEHPGMDAVRIMIDNDNDTSTGHLFGEPPIGADIMLEVYGRGNQIFQSRLLQFDTRYPRNAWVWQELMGGIPAAVDATRFEAQMLSGLLSSDICVRFMVVNWEGDHDLGDQALGIFVPTRAPANASEASGTGMIEATRAPEMTKTLYLRDVNTMNTQEGAAEQIVQLLRGDTYSWTQAPAFAMDFNITGQIPVYIYMVPILTGNNRPSVTATLYHNTVQIGFETLTDLTGAGWYTFTIPQPATAIPVGDALQLVVNVSGNSNALGVDIYYNSAAMNSRVVLPTDTYVNVEWVRTYNATGSEQYDFQAGDAVEVRANVSDPLGIYDIAGATVTVTSPNGSLIVDNQPMAMFLEDPSALQGWRIYNYSFALGLAAEGGKYTVEVTAYESNGVQSMNSSSFKIPVPEGVDLYPDSTITGAAGSNVDFTFFIENIGENSAVFDILPGVSSRGWRTELYINGTLAAYDIEGDGTWDWTQPGGAEISMPGNGTTTLVVRKVVPAGIEGEIDDTQIIAVSQTNASIWDSATATTFIPAPKKLKSFYMHSNDTLDTFNGSATTILNIVEGTDHSWTLSPPFASDFDVTTYPIATLYLVPYNQGHKRTDVTVTISYGATILGSQTLKDIVAEGWYSFAIPSIGVIPARQTLIATLSVGEGAVDVYYDSEPGAYDSRIDIPTQTYIKVNWLKSYNASVEELYFEAGSDVELRAMITDPIGIQDIRSAVLNVSYPNGTPLISTQGMSIFQSDAGNFWRIFNFTLTLPADTPVGNYTYNVTGFETNLVTHQISAVFRVKANVSVEPDNFGIGAPNINVSYNHFVNNTGKGADAFELSAVSDSGFNVSIYDASTGTKMASDTDGDGAWDWVNPGYDLNNDGNPDTGILLRGQGMEITVEIELPAVWYMDNTTLTAVSRLGISDSAVDVTVIPEFGDLLLPMLLMGAAVILARRKREMAK
jgi:hypothetical protein